MSTAPPARECAVCLKEVEATESTTAPRCGHVFHAGCLRDLPCIECLRLQAAAPEVAVDDMVRRAVAEQGLAEHDAVLEVMGRLVELAYRCKFVAYPQPHMALVFLRLGEHAKATCDPSAAGLFAVTMATHRRFVALVEGGRRR